MDCEPDSPPANLDLSQDSVKVRRPDDPQVTKGQPEKRYTAILDMIDGSDLLERRLGNWCSALVLFDPRHPKILFSLVQDSEGVIYGADENLTFLIAPETRAGDELPSLNVERREVLRTPPKVGEKRNKQQTAQIAVCFYNQKVGHFRSRTPFGLADWLQTLVPQEQERVRIYTLAGNPMMAKMANGENIHVVFEHIGQYAHDAVPGAYIALRAGAHMYDFDCNEITEEILARKLLTPSSKLQYVIASTRELAIEIAAALKKGQGMLVAV